MRFETSQSLKLGQSMKLAPRMIQSMEILQMPLAELEERLAQELENNPTLELRDGDGEPVVEVPVEDASADVETAPLRVDEQHGEADFERLDRYENDHPDIAENEFDEPRQSPREFDDGAMVHRVRADGERDAKMDAFAQTPARSASLVDQLRGQWALCDVDKKLRPLGELILQFIEEDGYLRTPLETIADRAPVGTSVNGTVDGELAGAVLGQKPVTADLERALQALQLFLEPAGVCARTPGECLLLQLDALEDEGQSLGWPQATYHNARTLVKDHLDDLMQNRLPKVAEKTGLTLEQIKEGLTLLKRLSLAPARRLIDANERPIVPDAIVEHDETQDRYIAYLNDAHLPSLRINEEYARLTRDKSMQKRDRDFIKTNLVNAQWLLDAVGQRRHTLLRVVEKVIHHQRDFFDYGPQALKPLPMTQVAEELGVHVATVSRAVSEKFIATPRGVMPLRKFFSGGLQTDGGEDMAWEAIRQALRDLIDGEDKKKPLSDDALSDALKAKGMDIARRTVAKYRDQLNIQPARLRKVF